jgi:hypothetical protein
MPELVPAPGASAMRPEIRRQFVTHPSFNKAVKLMRAICLGYEFEKLLSLK